MGTIGSSTELDADDLDAAVEPAALHDASSTAPDDAASTPLTDSQVLPYDSSVCVMLPDALFPMFAQPASPQLVFTSLSDAGCVLQDGGEDPYSNFYGLSDGKPLLQRGQRYAFTWTDTSVLQKVTLYSADVPCMWSLLTDQQLAPLGSLQVGAGCRDFLSPHDARYLLVPETNGSRLITGHNFKLCEGPCPTTP